MFVHDVLLVALKVKPPIILDRSVFPYQDIRNTGGGARPKVKREVKMAPGFLKPKVPMPVGTVSEVVEEGGVAMDEGPDDVAPLAAGSRTELCSCEGIRCSCGGYVCEAVGEDFVCPHKTGDDKDHGEVAENPERRVVLVEDSERRVVDNSERRIVSYVPSRFRGS